MDKIKDILIVLFVAGFVAGVGILLVKAVPQSEPQVNVGALAGPDIPYQYLSVNGVRTWNYSKSLVQASTTCSFQTPNATTSLRFAGARISTSPAMIHDVEWGKAITAFATTTSLGEGRSIASGVQYTTLASTTPDAIVDAVTVFAPNTYLNLKIGTSTFYAPIGNCYASFNEIQ